jgi:ubiquitin carboxyl-terminal hydrolase L3
VLELAHAEAPGVRQGGGGTVAPPAEDKNYFHFICFVNGGDRHLQELDKRMKGSGHLGLLAEEDALRERALRLGAMTILQK